MKTVTTTAVALSFGLLVGCASEVPVPTAYDRSYQPKMWAAHHWNLLAADVAQRLATALNNTEGASGSDPIVLHVQKPGLGTTFNTAFHDLLITQLIQHGFGVTRTPDDAALLVTYDVKPGGLADKAVQANLSEVDVPDQDIVVNVSVHKHNGARYVTRISEIFYIDQTTSNEYFGAPPLPPTRLVEVVGP